MSTRFVPVLTLPLKGLTGGGKIWRSRMHLSMQNNVIPNRNEVEARNPRFLCRGVYPEPSRRAPSK